MNSELWRAKGKRANSHDSFHLVDIFLSPLPTELKSNVPLPWSHCWGNEGTKQSRCAAPSEPELERGPGPAGTLPWPLVP